MQSIQYTIQGTSVIIETPKGFLSLTPYSNSAIRVRFAPTREFGTKGSLMIQQLPDVSIGVDVRETTESLVISTPKLSILINRQTNAFTYLTSTGQILTKEPDQGGKTLVPIDVVRSIFDETVEAETQVGADGVRVKAGPSKQVVDRQAFHTKLEFEWAPGEALYGLGSHEEGMMNLRGQHQYLYQQNMKTVVPVLLSTRGYGILFDNYSFMTFHDDAFGSYLWADVADELDYYFIYGPEFDQIIQSLRQLTGKAPMLPRWSFGYMQSKERYASQAELVDVVLEYRARGIPLDCIVQDWKSWPDDLWGQKTLDPERYPDPKGMMSELHRLNTRLMISIWPIMYPGGDNWRQMRDQGYLLGNRATYNAFEEKARNLYWKQTNEGLFSHGIDAWWCDCTEPFEADWTGDVRPEPEERMRINTEEAKKYLDPGYINAYSLEHSKGIYEGQRQITTDKRVVNLTRSAYAGQQRYSTITWSGDIVATWEALRRQIPAGLNFCATGLPYWTTDIGGFFVKDDPKLWFWSGDYDQGIEDFGYRELYVRWFQYGVFLPILRSHGTDTPRELWRFGGPGDSMYDSLLKFLRLRYRLMPYIYSLAGLTTQSDYTILRALPFDFRGDPATYDIPDQFMYGPAFLVNPVTQPMYYAARSTVIDGADKTRLVYLPVGADWYDFWTAKRYSGGQTICADAALNTMPLYVRSGAIVPMGPDIQFAGEQVNAVLELYIYPGQNGKFTLYDDEGDNFNYEQGAFSMILLSWDDSARRLTVHTRLGSYPDMPTSREFRLIVADNDTYTGISEARTLFYDGGEVTIDL